MTSPKRKQTTFMFETLPSFQDPERGGPSPAAVRPGHPDPSKGGEIKEFEWKGYLSPQDKFTIEKLKILEPRRHPAGVMAERAKLHERTPVFVEAGRDLAGRMAQLKEGDKYARHGKDGLVRYEKGRFLRSEDGSLLKKEEGISVVVKDHPPESAPVHEFLAGRKYITPQFVKAKDEALGDREPLRPETVHAFGLAIEHYAKDSGQKSGDVNYSVFSLDDDKGTQLAFTYIDEADRSYDALTSRTEIGTFSMITNNGGVPETVQYSIFNGANGPSIHRHVWLNDPDFNLSDIQPPADLNAMSEQETRQYDQFLAGQIENLYQMEQEVEQGYAAVDDAEANGALDFISGKLD